MGVTQRGAGCSPFCRLLSVNGAADDREEGAISADGLVMGTYLHGLFDTPALTRALLDALRERKGLAPDGGPRLNYAAWREQQFDGLAAALREHVDIARIYQLMRDHARGASSS